MDSKLSGGQFNLPRSIGFAPPNFKSHMPSYNTLEKGAQNRPIRILHLTSSRGFYGMEQIIFNLAENSDPIHFDVCLAAFADRRDPHYELVQALEKIGKRTYLIDCRKRIDSSVLRQLISVLKREHFDILHCHEQKSNVYGLIASREAKVPVLATTHSWNRPNLLETAYEILDGIILRFFDRIITVSDDLQHMMRRFFIPARLISVICNGISLERFAKPSRHNSELKKQLGIKPGMQVVGNVGRLSVQKGHRFLLEAAKITLTQCADVCFLIIGKGALERELKRYAAALGIQDRIIFAGFRNDMPELYAIMDLFAFTSLSEGLPLVILEAMASALPVIAVNVGGIADVIDTNQNGILLSSADPKKIAESIMYLLSHDDDRARISRNAVQTIKAKFSVQKMVQQYEAIYLNLLQTNKCAPVKTKKDLHAC